ncbi:MAG: class I SAM-dependent methyltransferase [Oligoflexia bacterium]|nr:class I SAM-dependent methyltransferase [Oligoflexia bacterium]
MNSHQISKKKIILLLPWPIFFLLKVIGRFLYFLGLKYQFVLDWGSYPNPEWFDHEFDLAFFTKWRKPHFFERGVYLQELLKKEMCVLDLCCGDGSVTALFIAPKVTRAIGVDFDPKAIQTARSKYGEIKNLEYQVADIRNLQFPSASFDAVTWDAAIEHFTEKEIREILSSIQRVLKPNGFLMGSTIAKQDFLQHHDHEFEFSTKVELESFLKKYFSSVYVWERSHDDRRNFYFRVASQNINFDTREKNF